jgi:hypothetical protein
MKKNFSVTAKRTCKGERINIPWFLLSAGDMIVGSVPSGKSQCNEGLILHDTMGDYYNTGNEGDLIFAPLSETARSGMTQQITPIVREMLDSGIILDVRGDYLRREKGDYELIYCAIRPKAIYNLRGKHDDQGN